MPPPVEISIPSTTISQAAAGSKPYTCYNITLRLPLRSFVVQKRYSEFEKLHQTLVSQVGAPPPVPLPAKSWFRSTVNSAELTERRRQGLEEYLQAIAGSPDRRWRDTPAWRSFLNLPAASSAAGSAASVSGVQGATATITTTSTRADPAEWVEQHRRMNDVLRDARACLARRDAAAAEAGSAAAGLSSSKAVEAGAAAKMALAQASRMLGALEEDLGRLRKDGALGRGEARRREDMLKEAREDHKWLTQLSATLSGGVGGGGSAAAGPASSGDRTALMGQGRPKAGGRVLGAPLQETERTRELDNSGVVQLQRQTMAEQDEDLEVLTRVIRRQKEMGLAIQEEVEQQTNMLDRMNQDVDRLDGKIRVAKNRTKKLGS